LPNVWNEIRDRDLLIVPSGWDGDGLVLVEAIVQRIPCIVSSIAEFHRFGLEATCYFDDVLDAAKQILYNLNDIRVFIPNQDLSTKVRNERDLTAIVNRWKSLLQQLLE
jgi:hypothetical protein